MATKSPITTVSKPVSRGMTAAQKAAQAKTQAATAAQQKFQAQQAESGYEEAITSAFRETQYDQPMEDEKAITTSP